MTAVIEHPILFSGPMVRAILACKKTQTRRVIRFRNEPFDPEMHNPWLCWRGGDSTRPLQPGDPEYQWQDGDDLLPCPYGFPRDRLWVRETFAIISPESVGEEGWGRYQADRAFRLHPDSNNEDGVAGAIYQTDGEFAQNTGWPKHWRPSIHMPRWASRILLEVVSVRAERLQDISEDDAIAEGVDAIPVGVVRRQATWDRRQDFAQLWDKINGKRGYAWENNPWVWAISFKAVTP